MFKFEFLKEGVRGWTADPDGGATPHLDEHYHPTVYIRPPAGQLDALADRLAGDPKLVATAVEEHFLELDASERRPVLRADVEREADVAPLAREVKHTHERALAAPGAVRLYNVDLAPQFRYCLETDTDPTPARPLTRLSIDLGEKALADSEVTALEIDGDPVATDPVTVLQTVDRRISEIDPDVLEVSAAAVIPLLFEAADRHGVDLALGRRPGYEQLAGANTFESYGRVGHSPARYDVPGRVVLDRGNSFLFHHSNLAGLRYLVTRSHKPAQEVGWASIGNVLTAIQIREAVERDVLVPWNKWRPEEFKDIHTLHAADRGGFIFQPDVGLHEGVCEVDFASLYPRIICEHNISPDTLGCDCHDNAPLPDLPYSICEDRGFLADVLEPLLDDRAAIKTRRATLEGIDSPNISFEGTTTERLAAAGLDPDAPDDLAATSSAIKWILVSCFGYQGYRNSKFGRIECHEAINAVARDVLLTAKECAEERGWRVVHGIVDSCWLEPVDPDHAPIDEVMAAVTQAVGIALDLEARYDWIAFCPRRETGGGALTRYFGRQADGGYKLRGIEARQRSTPPFVESMQRDLLDVVDETRDPEAVCERLRAAIDRLRARRVDPDDLVVRKRVSQSLAEYDQATHTVAALQRCRLHDLERAPGQDVRYVVVDDTAESRERVRLPFEPVDDYDADFYADLLVRAAESVIAPIGWDRTDIRRYLRGAEDYELRAFAE
ncbi:MAG: type B DNA-directed DNA polymerase [Salinirussus sp.]